MFQSGHPSQSFCAVCSHDNIFAHICLVWITNWLNLQSWCQAGLLEGLKAADTESCVELGINRVPTWTAALAGKNWLVSMKSCSSAKARRMCSWPSSLRTSALWRRGVWSAKEKERSQRLVLNILFLKIQDNLKVLCKPCLDTGQDTIIGKDLPFGPAGQSFPAFGTEKVIRHSIVYTSDFLSSPIQ